jgi:hypothetical protein
MIECKACNDEKLTSELSYAFNQADVEFCADRLSAEETDSVKWEIVDITITFCGKHKMEFLQN